MFDVSKRITIIIVIILLSIYIASSAPELATNEAQWGDSKNVQETVENWGIDDLQRFDVHVRYFLLSLSVNLFDNMKIIPFLASISLLILTFFVRK